MGEKFLIALRAFFIGDKILSALRAFFIGACFFIGVYHCTKNTLCCIFEVIIKFLFKEILNV